MNEEPNGNRNYNEVDGRRFSYTKNNNALFICLAAFQAAKWPAAATFTQIGLRLHYLFFIANGSDTTDAGCSLEKEL